MYSLLLAIIYISFIGLGLPDSLLGSAWPVMHQEISVPISYAGIISAVISLGTIVSSFFSDRIVRRFGSGLVTAMSMGITALSLFGFSVIRSFPVLLLISVPYGLGAGAVDAALNNYIALKYKTQHMNWLHCFWGVGASVSPYIMSFSMTRLSDWSRGYFIVSVLQIILTLIVFISLPLWKKSEEDHPVSVRAASLREIFSMKCAVHCFTSFFLYCAFELTTALWMASYLVMTRGVDAAQASGVAGLYYLGITVGRAISGFLAIKMSDERLIRLGYVTMCVGLVAAFFPLGIYFCAVGLFVLGIGSAPIYPSVIHTTPTLFGEELSQTMIGIQMAFAYMGFCLMPPLFGFIAEKLTISLLPVFIGVMLVVMIVCCEIVIKGLKKKAK